MAYQAIISWVELEVPRYAAGSAADLSCSANSESYLLAELTTGIKLEANLNASCSCTATLDSNSYSASVSWIEFEIPEQVEVLPIALEANAVSNAVLNSNLTTGIRLAVDFVSSSFATATLDSNSYSASVSWIEFEIPEQVEGLPIQLEADLGSTSYLLSELTTGIKLEANLNASCSSTSALSTGIRLEAFAYNVVELSSLLNSGVLFNATLSATPSLNATLTGVSAALVASPSSTCSLSSELSTGVNLAANLVANSTLQSSLSAEALFSASLVSNSISTAELTSSILFNQALNSTCSLSSELSTGVSLAANLVATSVFDSNITTTPTGLSANIGSLIDLTSNLSTGIKLEANAVSNSVLNSDLTTRIQLAVDFVSTNSVGASLFVTPGTLSSDAISAVLVSSSLDTGITLEANSVSNSTLSSNLTTGIPLAVDFVNEVNFDSNDIQTGVTFGEVYISNSCDFVSELSIGALLAANLISSSTFSSELYTETIALSADMIMTPGISSILTASTAEGSQHRMGNVVVVVRSLL